MGWDGETVFRCRSRATTRTAGFSCSVSSRYVPARRVSAVKHAHRCPNEYRLLEVPELPSACPHWPAGPRQQAARRSADLGALPTDRSLAPCSCTHARVATPHRTARCSVHDVARWCNQLSEYSSTGRASGTADVPRPLGGEGAHRDDARRDHASTARAARDANRAPRCKTRCKK